MGADGTERSVTVRQQHITEETMHGTWIDEWGNKSYTTSRGEHVNVDESTGVMSLPSGVTLTRLPN